MAFTKILVCLCLFVVVLASENPKKGSDLKTYNSYSLGYSLGYPGLGYGGLGYGLGYSKYYYPSYYSGYGGYGGYGGLDYGYTYPKYGYSHGYSWPYSGYYGSYYG